MSSFIFSSVKKTLSSILILFLLSLISFSNGEAGSLNARRLFVYSLLGGQAFIGDPQVSAQLLKVKNFPQAATLSPPGAGPKSGMSLPVSQADIDAFEQSIENMNLGLQLGHTACNQTNSQLFKDHGISIPQCSSLLSMSQSIAAFQGVLKHLRTLLPSNAKGTTLTTRTNLGTGEIETQSTDSAPATSNTSTPLGQSVEIENLDSTVSQPIDSFGSISQTTSPQPPPSVPDPSAAPLQAAPSAGPPPPTPPPAAGDSSSVPLFVSQCPKEMSSEECEIQVEGNRKYYINRYNWGYYYHNAKGYGLAEKAFIALTVSSALNTASAAVGAAPQPATNTNSTSVSPQQQTQTALGIAGGTVGIIGTALEVPAFDENKMGYESTREQGEFQFRLATQDYNDWVKQQGTASEVNLGPGTIAPSSGGNILRENTEGTGTSPATDTTTGTSSDIIANISPGDILRPGLLSDPVEGYPVPGGGPRIPKIPTRRVDCPSNVTDDQCTKMIKFGEDAEGGRLTEAYGRGNDFGYEGQKLGAALGVGAVSASTAALVAGGKGDTQAQADLTVAAAALTTASNAVLAASNGAFKLGYLSGKALFDQSTQWDEEDRQWKLDQLRKKPTQPAQSTGTSASSGASTGSTTGGSSGAGAGSSSGSDTSSASGSSKWARISPTGEDTGVGTGILDSSLSGPAVTQQKPQTSAARSSKTGIVLDAIHAVKNIGLGR